MIDINNILTQALTAAVTEATKPLHEAVQALAARIEALENRLTDADVKALETDTLSPDDLVQVKQRIEALEQATPETPAAISAAAFVTYLDQQEWFWEKLTSKAAEAAESAVEEAINDHCSTYDHDDYDNVSSAVNEVDLDEIVTIDNLRSEIKDVFRNASVSIDV